MATLKAHEGEIKVRCGISDNGILEFQRAAANGVVKKLYTVKATGPVPVAIEMVLTRIVASGDSLALLRSAARHNYGFDAAAILRSIYDVMLQGLYIMAIPAKREQRARLYLDFMEVERIRRIELVDTSATWFGKQIGGSPKRFSAEPKMKSRFNAVKAKYQTKKGGMRDTWYPETLRDLAKSVGLESEYQLMQRLLSGVVHSSPLTLADGPFVRDFLVSDWHWRFAFRVLGAYAQYKGVALSQTEQGLVDAAKGNVFELG